MPVRKAPTVARTERNRARRKRDRIDRAVKAQSNEHPYGVPVPDGLHDAIERERDNLGKAESLLGCLAIALEHPDANTDAVPVPYYPDVAHIARQLVRSSINGLDSITLQRLVLRNKVKESPAHVPLPAPPFLTSHIEMGKGCVNAFVKVQPVRALHRRHYAARAFNEHSPGPNCERARNA